MKKSLLVAALLPLLVLGCAKDRHDKDMSAYGEPGMVDADGYDRIDRADPDRADARFRVEDDANTGRRMVREDAGFGEADAAPAITEADEIPEYTDNHPDHYTPSGLNHWLKHRWFRNQY